MAKRTTLTSDQLDLMRAKCFRKGRSQPVRLPAQVRSHTLSEGCALGTPDRAFSQVEALNVESC